MTTPLRLTTSTTGDTGQLLRLLRRNAAMIQAIFATLWAVRLAATGWPWEVPLAVAVAGVVITRRAFRATTGMQSRTASRTAAGKQFLRPVTVATVAQLVASIVLPVVASAAGAADWSLPLVGASISVFLIVFGRQLRVQAVSAIGVAYTVVSLGIPVIMSTHAIAATVSGVSAAALLLSSAWCGSQAGSDSPT